jgi:hypothetical protein
MHPSGTGGPPIFGNPPTGPKIPVIILGQLVVDGPNNAIGAADDATGSMSPVASAAILGGCWAHNGGWVNPPCDYNSVNANAGGSGVYADDFGPALPSPQPTKPVIDVASVYNSASPGPMQPCTTGSTGSTFTFDSAGSTTPDTSLGTVDMVDFLGPTAWDCQTAGGRLKWTPGVPAGTDGTLYVSGKVFVDASFDLNHTGTHQGVIKLDAPLGGASIYLNGKMEITDGASLCAVYDPGATGSDPPCDFVNWVPNSDPTDPVVFLAAYNGGSSNTDGWIMGNHTYFQGLAYTNGGFFLDPNAEMAGSIFADYGTIKGNAKFQITDNVPQGAPGASTTIVTTTWSAAPRTWRECPSVAGC